jgi:hypothetical protein
LSQHNLLRFQKKKIPLTQRAKKLKDKSSPLISHKRDLIVVVEAECLASQQLHHQRDNKALTQTLIENIHKTNFSKILYTKE